MYQLLDVLEEEIDRNQGREDTEPWTWQNTSDVVIQNRSHRQREALSRCDPLCSAGFGGGVPETLPCLSSSENTSPPIGIHGTDFQISDKWYQKLKQLMYNEMEDYFVGRYSDKFYENYKHENLPSQGSFV